MLAFLFPTASDRWVSVLRFGLGLQVVCYSLSLRDEWLSLFSAGGSGVVSRRLSEIILAHQSVFIPQVNWLVLAGEQLGFNEDVTLGFLWWLLLSAGLLLLAGFLGRAAAVVAWFVHLAVAKSGGLFAYGVDNFMTIGLFYLMLAPSADRLSLDAKIWPRAPATPDRLGFLRRVLQLHLCVIYFFSGLTKAFGLGWWNGDNLWHALTRPPFDILSADWLAHHSDLLVPAGIFVWVLELMYPVLIWNARTRTPWLALICAMHAAIALTMGMYLFGLVMIVLNLAAFGPAMPITRQPAARFWTGPRKRNLTD